MLDDGAGTVDPIRKKHPELRGVRVPVYCGRLCTDLRNVITELTMMSTYTNQSYRPGDCRHVEDEEV